MITLVTIAAFVGFVAFIVAVARLGGSEVTAFGGLFGRPGTIDRALGVQEADLPPFRFGASAG
jgi:hypothetical protein